MPEVRVHNAELSATSRASIGPPNAILWITCAVRRLSDHHTRLSNHRRRVYQTTGVVSIGPRNGAGNHARRALCEP